MNIRNGNVRINPMSRDRLTAYVMGKKRLEELLRIDSVEENVKNTDFRAILESCDIKKKHDYWHTAWVVIDRKKAHAVGVMRYDREGLPNHTVRISLPEDSAYPRDIQNAFLIMCRWAVDYDRILKLVTQVKSEEMRRFLLENGFTEVEESNFVYVKRHRTWLPVFGGLGMAVGFLLGFLFHSIALGLALGLPLGVCIGVYLDQDEKRKLTNRKKDE